MSKNKASLHVKMYVDEVLSGCLKNAGFTCPDEKSLYWYRLKENDIINVITFYSPWRNLPVMLFSGYGIHSLYHRPMYSTSLSHDTRPLNGLLCCKHPIVENTSYDRMSYRQYSDEILVMVPDILGRGLYTIEGKILPVMDSINTFEECYQLHKQRRLDDLRGKTIEYIMKTVCGEFIDEAIYMDDYELFPYFLPRVLQMKEFVQKRIDDGGNVKEESRNLYDWERREAVLRYGNREEFIKHMEKRKAENIQYLRKRLKLL